MATETCPHCGGTVQTDHGPVRYCPYCGGLLAETAQKGPSALEKRIMAETKPERKFKIIQEALAASPDDFEANRALLYHGRLHEKLAKRKGLDYSVIRCHLMSIFENPAQYTPQELDAKYEELLRDPQLIRTMALAPDGDAFFDEYIRDMAYLYIDLFLRGDSKNSTFAFGFGRSLESTAGRCAIPTKAMLAEIRQTSRLTEAERALLYSAVRSGFARIFLGHEALLDM